MLVGYCPSCNQPVTSSSIKGNCQCAVCGNVYKQSELLTEPRPIKERFERRIKDEAR